VTRPRDREHRGASIDPTTRSGATAAVANGRLLRLFRRTLKDQTPQQRRLLAGDIALEIPSEAVTRGHPEPLWMQHLRTFVRRELDLDPSPQPFAGVAVETSDPPDAQIVDAGIASSTDRLDGTSRTHTVAAASDRRGGRPATSPERARRFLLARVKHFRDGRGPMEPLTNVGLAKATRPVRDEETIGNWLRRAGWTLDDLDREWERRSPKKPE